MSSNTIPSALPWTRRLTRVTVDGRSERAGGLGVALGELGFQVRSDRGVIFADSTEVEGQHVKAYLRGRGFADREYQVFVEFVRRWGSCSAAASAWRASCQEGECAA